MNRMIILSYRYNMYRTVVYVTLYIHMVVLSGDLNFGYFFLQR